ncbi:MAG: ribose-phosphate pyrophosphokinase [Spirochaetales bacterium]|nr:ribose-phosphate pyrophosphokinase [Spirochaetales bacterium]
MKEIVIVGSASENAFVEDIAHHLNQHEDYLDIISLKTFLNTEFCPRFIVDEHRTDNIGNKLAGKEVVIVTTSFPPLSRDELAMRNFLIARAAKDNGADRVCLLEPDLFYSAQDRGPRPEHGITDFERDLDDFRKFDGQPFSARLYADLLKMSGVDAVVTVHNHSSAVEKIFMDRFSGNFYNLTPAEVYASYLRESDIVRLGNLVLCAPDEGAKKFVEKVHRTVGDDSVEMLFLEKCRRDERDIELCFSESSPIRLQDIRDRDVIVIDDMVRTGTTIAECCKLLKEYNPRRILFFVTHFYSSREGRTNLNTPAIDEIVTTSTIPSILNRDMQGRLRHKLVVLKISRWISNYILKVVDPDAGELRPPLYKEDMSSKNPRWHGTMGPLFSAGLAGK